MRTAIFLAALLVTGCSARAMQHDPPPVPSARVVSAAMTALDGSEWRFVEIRGTAVPPDVSAVMRMRGNRVSGKAGCNTYGARYHLAADGSASFSQVLSTQMACIEPADVMQIGHRIFAILPHVARIERQGGGLEFFDAGGSRLARLEPAGEP
ncbi:MAG: META domain-containing protein [Rhodanobacteraceae bacterium]